MVVAAENTTMHSVCIAELHVTVNNLKSSDAQKMLLGRIYVAGKNVNQIWIF